MFERSERVRASSRSKGLLTAALAVSFLLPVPAPAAPIVETLTFLPVADSYVKEIDPNTNFGKSTSLYLDRRDAKESFLRFSLEGLDGYAISNVRLRMYQKDASAFGGQVYELSDHSWTESGLTWNNRPSGYKARGPISSIGAVTKGQWYELDLGTPVSGNGPLSLALDSTSSDGVNWGSRQSLTPPVLEVDIVEDDTNVKDGLSTVAAPTVGSSDPTYHATNHRVAVTDAGRLLAVHGRHATGLQLAWRNPWGPWRNDTTGSLGDGLLLKGTGTGDWSASIALADDSGGEQHAWVVWSGPTSGSIKALQMRRLSNLDAPGGPRVGPVITIAPTGLSNTTGNSKVDIGFEEAPDGSLRGVVTWLKRTGISSYDYAYTWFSDLDSDAPAFHDTGKLFSSTTGGYQGTLTTTPTGIAWLGRTATGALRMYRHAAGTGPGSWTSSSAGIGIGSNSYPSATTLASNVLVAVESDPSNHVVKVQRFTTEGPEPSEAVFNGYRNPTIASDGTSAWVVMVRHSDGLIVSRQMTNGAWSTQDRVEIGVEGGGSHAWPNAVRTTDGRLRFIVEGPAGGLTQNAVLAFQRTLAE